MAGKERTTKAILIRNAAASLLFIGLLLVAATLRDDACWAGGGEESGSPAPTPVFAEAQPAAAPAKLCLLVDSRKVLGWISGAKSYAGREVRIKTGGAERSVVVQRNNTFTWYYRFGKPSRAEFTVGKLSATAGLSSPEKHEPSVFFVVDRTVCRPGQTIHLAGFLREYTAEGRFVPIGGRAVGVKITSVKKRTLARKVRLTSDDFGRVTWSYTFTKSDALDDYVISADGYKGEARVKLAEFRKSKIRLKVSGKVEKSALKLNFEAVDFLDKPVAGSKVFFTAQVVRGAKTQKKGELKAKNFVYYRKPFSWMPLFENLPEEQKLLCEAGTPYAPSWGGRGPAVLATIREDVDMKGRGRASCSVPLRKEWTARGHAMLIQGVLVDQNGREQRTSKLIRLDERSGRVELTVPKRDYSSGETVTVTGKVFGKDGKEVKTGLTLVAMRLSAAGGTPAWSPNYYRQWGGAQIYSGARHPSAWGRRRGAVARWGSWKHVPAVKSVTRTMVTAAPFSGGRAAVKLAEPGAYLLVGVARTPDGSDLRGEVGCVVREPDAQPGVILRLERSTWKAGEILRGEIHSRFAGARVLLTLRDSRGLRTWRILRLKGISLLLAQRLPEDLGYGCSLEVQCVGNDGRAHIAEKFIRVRPVDRILTIKTRMKKVCDPGEKIKIAIEVNRREPVDLVVSVYDQSLLGIAPDRSVDVRDFYLADERAREYAAEDRLRRKLAGVTVEELAARAGELIKEKKVDTRDPWCHLLKAIADKCRHDTTIRAYEIPVLLRLAGVDATCFSYSGSWYYRLKKKNGPHPLYQVMQARRSQWRLVCRMVGNQLALYETHPRHRNRRLLGGSVRYQSYGARGYGARGDSHHSASANAMHSASGQAFISHLPAAAAPVRLIDLDPGHSGISVRRNFSDSAFWNAKVRTDRSGKATVEFKLPDSLTNWMVVVTAVSSKMHVGRHTDRFRTFKPIMVWPMVPRIFTQGDEVRLYASVHTRTDRAQSVKVRIKVKNGKVLDSLERSVRVGPKSRAPVYWTFRAGDPGFTQLLMSASCAAGSDASLKRLPVASAAVERQVTLSGFCRGTTSFTVPKEAKLEDSCLEISFAPSLAADMVDTLDYLVQYPHGCVEQTMSRFLPAIKVAQILKKFDVKHAPLKKRLPGCVAGGIKRLLQLQRADGGWGWNGNGRTHEMMTPYALYGLMEAEKAGYKLGAEKAIEKGMGRLRTFISQMGEKQAADRIYCMYVYSYRHKLPDDWWRFISTQQRGKKLSDYALAMSLEMAVRAGRKGLARGLAAALRARPRKSAGRVHWRTARFSRWGDDPHEITAAALKALVAYDPDDELIPGVLSYFAATKRGNRWNSTKDTALILFAMCDYLAAQKADSRAARAPSFAINGGESQKVAFTGGLTRKIRLPGGAVHSGRNTLSFPDAAPGTLYRLVFRYKQVGRSLPAEDNGIRVTRRFYLLDEKGSRQREIKAGAAVPRGAYIECMVAANSSLGRNMRYVLIEAPKPSSCEILPADDKRFNQTSSAYVLREDKTAGVLYHHEQTNGSLRDRYVLHAELAGRYVVPAATAELMYATETRGHSGTFHFTVKG